MTKVIFLYYSSPPGILIKGLTIALLLSQFGSGSQNPIKHLREVGPPPNTIRRQNSLNRLCSVCAGLCCKKIFLCCFVFLDIEIIFIGHSEVTPPPPNTPNSPQIVSFVWASFVLVCAGKSFVCAASVFKLLDIEL